MLQDWRREEGNPSMPLKTHLNNFMLDFIFNLIKAFTVNEIMNVLEDRTKWLKQEIHEMQLLAKVGMGRRWFTGNMWWEELSWDLPDWQVGTQRGVS